MFSIGLAAFAALTIYSLLERAADLDRQAGRKKK